MSEKFANIPVDRATMPSAQVRLFGKKFLQRALLIVLKIVVLVFSARYLYQNVLQNVHFADIYKITAATLHQPGATWLFSICLVLVIANWGFEALKWKFVLRKFQDISLLRSFSAILSGTAISLLMPNRTGEYLGRVFFLDPSIRIKSIFATFIGSLSQLVITLVLGAVGFIYYEKSLHYPGYIQAAVVIGALIFIALIIFFYFNIRVIRSLLPARKWSKSLRKYLKVYRLYHAGELEKILLFSLARYLIFSVQFYVFMLFFGVHVPFFNALMLIFLMYLVQTISPTNGFTELVVRGGTTAFLFKAYTVNLAAVLAASYSLWAINLLIPGLAGALIFGFGRIYKRNKAV